MSEFEQSLDHLKRLKKVYLAPSVIRKNGYEQLKALKQKSNCEKRYKKLIKKVSKERMNKCIQRASISLQKRINEYDIAIQMTRLKKNNLQNKNVLEQKVKLLKSQILDLKSQIKVLQRNDIKMMNINIDLQKIKNQNKQLKKRKNNLIMKILQLRSEKQYSQLKSIKQQESNTKQQNLYTSFRSKSCTQQNNSQKSNSNKSFVLRYF